MRRKRVLIVDDSVVVRRILSDIVLSDPTLEVAATAAHGRIALAKIPQVQPDIITLDLEMPEMNGIETLSEIQKQYPGLPVIVFSAQTENGGAATLDALALGACDFVAKPSSLNGDEVSIRHIQSELIEKIKVFCKRSYGEIFHKEPHVPTSQIRAVHQQGSQIQVVAIGISTGGPNALAAMIPELPADFPVPLLIVQHMPPVFTRLMAERLDSASRIKVREARPGDVPEPGLALIAPGDFHMGLERVQGSVRIRTHQGPPENSCRPSVDVLFRSVAEVYGSNSLAVVMTGMGQDGLLGCDFIREAGGQIIVQDEASSVVWGMPGFVARAGLADKILPLQQMSAEISRRAKAGIATADTHTLTKENQAWRD